MDSAAQNIEPELSSKSGGRVGTRSPDIFLRLLSSTVEVRDALDRILAETQSLKVNTATCDTSQIILAEILNNVVEHAYGFEEGHPIELSLWLTDQGLACKVQDCGAPMPNGVPPAGLSQVVNVPTRDQLPEGGFGWAMVRELTQDLCYERVNDRNALSFLIPHAPE